MLSYRECGILLKKSRSMHFFYRHKKRLRKKDHCMYRKFGKRILGIILSGCGIRNCHKADIVFWEEFLHQPPHFNVVTAQP